MKKAIIITGQLRTNELTKWFHKNSFIDDDNCDIFLSIDVDNRTQLLYKNDISETNQNSIEETIKFYKPKAYYVGKSADEKIINDYYKDLCNQPIIYYDINDLNNNNKQKEIELFLIEQEKQSTNKKIIKNLSYNCGNKKNGRVIESSIKGLFRQFYYVNEGYKLLKEYKNKNNVKYDFVMRIRFDHIIFTNDFVTNELNDYTLKDKSIIFCENNLKLAQNIKNLNMNFDDINHNTINVMGIGIYKKYVYVNDFFWTHGDDLIEKMLKFYEQLHDIIKFTMSNFFPVYGAGIEHYFAIFLFKNKIDINQTKMNKFNIVRKK